MMAYTYKMVNGVKIALNSGDQTKLARLAAAFKLTVAELKAEIFRP